MKTGRWIVMLLGVAALFTMAAPAAMAQEGDGTGESAVFEVTELVVDPAEATVGRMVTVKVTIANTGGAEGTYTADLRINGETEDSRKVTIAAGGTELIELGYTPDAKGTYTVSVGERATDLEVVLDGSEAAFREGPVVRLRPVTDEVTSSSDGLVELFFSNPSLNDVTLVGDVWVSVPSGIHVYGEGFGLAGAAGTVYGQFTAPPGTGRTIHLNIKADETAVGETHYIHFTGQYWPEGNKDAYNPISLTHPVKVVAASPNPGDATPTEELGGVPIYWWVIIGVVFFGGIAIIMAVRSRKTEVSIEQ